jgi:predicted Zn-ribbon and HTH transcriptional regulator
MGKEASEMPKHKGIKEKVFEILSKQKKPMHVAELTALVKKQLPMEGKTPEKTVNAICQRHPEIKRVGPGTFQKS